MSRHFAEIETAQLAVIPFHCNPSMGSKDRRGMVETSIDVPVRLFDADDLDRIDLTCVDISTHIAFRS